MKYHHDVIQPKSEMAREKIEEKTWHVLSMSNQRYELLLNVTYINIDFYICVDTVIFYPTFMKIH